MTRFLFSLFILALCTPAYAGLYVSPKSLEQNASGFALSGGLLYFYEPGTTTLKTVYQEKTFATPHTNPVVADSAGRFDPIFMDGTYKVVLKDSDDVTIFTEDNYTTGGSSDFFGETEAITATTAIDGSYEKKHIRATNAISLNLLSIATAGEGFMFTMINDGTGNVTIDPNASEQINDLTTFIVPPKASGIVISDGSEWSFVNGIGASQTLATTGDLLIAGTSSPEWGTSFSSDYTFTGDVTHTSAQVQWAKGADVASATALPILTDGNYFDVTGTTAVTSINTTGAVGSVIRLHFDGALTLTHHATNLVLPSGASITTAAGDEAEFVEYASGDFRCTSYTKASGKPVITSLTSGTAQATTSGASFDFTGIPSGVSHIIVSYEGISLDGTANVLLQLGDSGGLEATGYTSVSMQIDGAPNGVTSTTGYVTLLANAGFSASGTIELTLIDAATFTWIASGVFGREDSAVGITTNGKKSLSAELTQLRILDTASDDFDAGKINIIYQ